MSLPFYDLTGLSFVNEPINFTGNFLTYQLNGVTKFNVDYQGNTTLTGTIPAANLTGSHTLPDGVLSTNVPLLNAANIFTDTLVDTNSIGVQLLVPQQNATSLAAGGSLVSGTTYYYVLTGIDIVGGETTKSNEASATPSGGNLTVNVNWSVEYGAMKVRIYRSTVSGNYSGATYYDVLNIGINGTITFADTGAAGTGTGTPPSVSTAYASRWKATATGVSHGTTNYIGGIASNAGSATLAFGPSPFDAASTGAFQLTASFAHIAMNIPFNTSIDFLSFQNGATSGVNTSDNLCFVVGRRGGMIVGSQATPVLRSFIRTPILTNLITGLSGGTLLDNTTYYYVIAAVDPRGIQSIRSNELSVTTGNSGTNINTATLTWSQSAITNVSWFYVYRSTTSGAYTSVSRYQVMNTGNSGILTFLDTGAATSTGSVTVGMSTNVASSMFLDPGSTAHFFSNTPGGNRGTINLGSGPFDSTSPGAFSANPVTLIELAINMRNGVGGYPIVIQQAAAASTAAINGTANYIFRIDQNATIDMKSGGALHMFMTPPTPNTPTTSVVGGTLLDNTIYYYEVTSLDPLASESWPSSQVQVTTGNSGSNINTNTVTWGAVVGAMGYRVYRSITTGNFTNSTRYTVVNATTFSDTGATGTTATPPVLFATGAYSLRLEAGTRYVFPAVVNTANRGYLSIGSGPLDGASTGFFVGSNSGTHLAINAVSAFAGAVIDAQIAGQSLFLATHQASVPAIKLNSINTASGQLSVGLPYTITINTPSTSTSGGTLLDNTTYYYEVTPLDVLGGENGPSAQVQVTTGNSGGNTNSNTVTWNLIGGVSSWRVYRSTTSGNFTNSTRYSVIHPFGANLSFLDTGAAGTTATPPAVGTNAAAYALRLDTARSGVAGYYFTEVGAAAGHGHVSIGSGAMDNTSTGTFQGNTGGTALAINLLNGSGGTVDIVNFQIAAASGVNTALNQKLRIKSTGDTFLGFGAFLNLSMAAPTTVSNVVSSGGNLSATTTYFYVVTALDSRGRETIKSLETSGLTTSSNKTITVSWNAATGPTAYRVYRSTTSGNYTNASYYLVLNASPTATSFADTGAGATGTATPTTSLASVAGAIRFDPGINASHISDTSTSSPNFGLLNIGSGAFDGVTTGFFAGNGSGTLISINALSGYGGNLIDWQVAGVSKILAQAALVSTNSINYGLKITPTIVQSSTGGYTALFVNVTESTTGSGVKLLTDLQLGTVSKFSVTSAGNVAFAGVMVPGVLDAPSFSSTLSLTVTSAEVHKVGSITGAMTVNASAGGSAGQRMTIILPNDSSGTGWVITFGTNFKSAGTLTGTSAKSSSISWMSDGTSWYEVCRATGLTL